MYRFVLPPIFGYEYTDTTPLLMYSFELLQVNKSKKGIHCVPAEIKEKFKKFSSNLIGQGISLYTDGSKSDEEFSVEAAVLTRTSMAITRNSLAIRHKLPTEI